MNDQDFERGLSDALQRASSELPENAHRYQQVQSRRSDQVRRRHRVVGGLAAAAVVAVLGIGVGGSIMRGATQQAAERESAGAADSSVADNGQLSQGSAAEAMPTPRCPEQPRELGNPEPTGDGRFVPEGAVTARLCASVRQTKNLQAYSAAGERLDHGVDELVAMLNDLRPYGKEDCADEKGQLFDLVLGYPDSSRVVVTFDSSGCGAARSGDEYRQGASGLMPADALSNGSGIHDLLAKLDELSRKQEADD